MHRLHAENGRLARFPAVAFPLRRAARLCIAELLRDLVKAELSDVPPEADTTELLRGSGRRA